MELAESIIAVFKDPASAPERVYLKIFSCNATFSASLTDIQ